MFIMDIFSNCRNIGTACDSNDKINGNQTPNLGAGNPVKIEGSGSAGRSEAINLNEQMVSHEVKIDLFENATNTGIQMNDERKS